MANIENQNPNALVTLELINDLRQIIDSARSHVAATANYELTMMYWHLGDRINRDLLNNERAEYGQQIVSQVATQLQKEYGMKGFDEKSIRRMMQFAHLMPDSQIVAQLATKLFWSHFIEVLSLAAIRQIRNPYCAVSYRVAFEGSSPAPIAKIPCGSERFIHRPMTGTQNRE